MLIVKLTAFRNEIVIQLSVPPPCDRLSQGPLQTLEPVRLAHVMTKKQKEEKHFLISADVRSDSRSSTTGLTAPASCKSVS